MDKENKQMNEAESKIVGGIMKGMSNREIAYDIAMTEGTVKNYISILLNRYYCKNRVELALLFIDEKRKNGIY
jgi:DNA-binding NarL/FixJ family response regulator